MISHMLCTIRAGMYEYWRHAASADHGCWNKPGRRVPYGTGAVAHRLCSGARVRDPTTLPPRTSRFVSETNWRSCSASVGQFTCCCHLRQHLLSDFGRDLFIQIRGGRRPCEDCELPIYHAVISLTLYVFCRSGSRGPCCSHPPHQ